MRKIGILGGTFDPIHVGHLRIAEDAFQRVGLDKVIFIPAGRPWLKSGQSVTDPEHRLAMVRLAIADNPHFEASAIEVERPGLTYTVDTLAQLRDQMADDDELYLILGMDSVRDLGRWHQPEQIFDMCTVVAMSRPDSVNVSVADLEREFPSAKGKLEVIRGPLVDISATEIRSRVPLGLSISGCVPEAVEDYIRKEGLYT